MKSKISLFLALALTAFVMVECKKKTDDPEPEPEPTPSAGISSLADLFATNGSPFVNFTVSATAPSTITTNDVTIEFPANAFETSTSGTVTGNVVISVKTILTKDQIILSGAQANSTNARLVTTKGCVKLTASQNSQSLRLSPSSGGTVFVSLPDGPVTPPATKKYYVGKLSVSDSTKVWAMEADTNDVQAVWSPTLSKYVHRAGLDSLKWLNVGKQWDTTGLKVAMVATVNASMFNKNNCAVYISFNGSKTIGAMYEISPGVYRISNMPNGKGVHIIGISVIDGQYYSAIMSTAVSSGTFGLNMQPTTIAQLATDLKNLQ